MRYMAVGGCWWHGKFGERQKVIDIWLRGTPLFQLIL